MKTLENAYAILIGVGADLAITVKDAEAIYKLLIDPELAGYKKENIILLTEEQAVRDKILGAFDTLIEKTDDNSSVFIYYSGHGGTFTDNQILKNKFDDPELLPEDQNKTHYFLQPNDMTAENYDTAWVKADELKQKINALQSRRLIMMLDCCHAEGMTKSAVLDSDELKKRLQSRVKNPEVLIHALDDGRGISMVTACRAEEQSFIPPNASHSLFTSCLLEALSGEGRSYFEEPYVRMTDVINYIMRRVPEQEPRQNPFVNLQMYDNFILSKVPSEKYKTTTPTPVQIKDISENEMTKASEVVTTFRKNNGVNALLFVHGFSGLAHESFGKMPEMLAKNETMNGWDLFPLGYSRNQTTQEGRGIWASEEDLKRLTDYLNVGFTTQVQWL